MVLLVLLDLYWEIIHLDAISMKTRRSFGKGRGTLADHTHLILFLRLLLLPPTKWVGVGLIGTVMTINPGGRPLTRKGIVTRSSHDHHVT